MKRSPLKQVGRKTAREQAEREEMRRIVIGECGGRCVGRSAMPQIECWGRYLEVHELVDRAVRPGVHLDADYGVSLCHPHHEYVTLDATRAREIGMSFFSWDWEQALVRVKELRRLAWRTP